VTRSACIVILIAACSSKQPPPAPAAPWPVPAGWKSETIPFPLDFAPKLAHKGIEELRFAPGFFDPAAPGYWSYAFVWRTENPADLDAAALGAELTAYFRGLIDAVDAKKEIAERDAVVAKAKPAGNGFALEAHVFDALRQSRRSTSPALPSGARARAAVRCGCSCSRRQRPACAASSMRWRSKRRAVSPSRRSTRSRRADPA
jgi:hypothetical protein